MSINIITFIGKKFRDTSWPEKWFKVPDGEKAIKWIDDPRKYYFVRSRIFYSSKRDTSPGNVTAGKVLGYSILNKDQKRDQFGFFVRRYFYLTPFDLRPDCIYYKAKCHPGEGVDPKTIKPGVWGVHIQPSRSLLSILGVR